MTNFNPIIWREKEPLEVRIQKWLEIIQEKAKDKDAFELTFANKNKDIYDYLFEHQDELNIVMSEQIIEYPDGFEVVFGRSLEDVKHFRDGQ